MRGNSSLRLTAVYIWAGQLFAILLSVAVTTTTPAFWLWQGVLFGAGLVLLLVTNWKYWFVDATLPDWSTDFLGWIRRCTTEEMQGYLDAIKFTRSGFRHKPDIVQPEELTIRQQIGNPNNPNSKIEVFYAEGKSDRVRLSKGDLLFIEGKSDRVRLSKGDLLFIEGMTDRRYMIIDITHLQEPGRFLAYIVKQDDYGTGI